MTQTGRTGRAQASERSLSLSTTQKAVNEMKAAFPSAFGAALDRIIAQRCGDIRTMADAEQIRTVIDIADAIKTHCSLTPRRAAAVSALRGECMAQLMNMFGAKGGREYAAGVSKVEVYPSESAFSRKRDDVISALKRFGLPIPFETGDERASREYTQADRTYRDQTFALVEAQLPNLLQAA